MSDTIVAISTPLGTGGVGVIRLSGDKSERILKKIFTPQKAQEFTPRKMVFGKVSFNNITDNCLAVVFNAPNSFTGEDVVEIQMHGGIKLLQETVSRLISLGARMALPGEFSKRAVLNGKMDITEAEGLIDMINARSVCQLQVASSQMGGELHKKIVEMQTTLTNLLATIEVALDFPEHEETFAEAETKEKIPKLISLLKTLCTTQSVGTKIKNGVSVALVGKANVGKSSLLNALVGFDRAIVTNIAGTTRDTICESYEYNGVIFNIVDTAGLRQTDDPVEKEGIKRSVQTINECDITLKVWDSDEIMQDSDEILSHTPKNFINVLNKCDLVLTTKFPFDIMVSAKKNTNIDKLKQLIYDKTIDKNLLSNEVVITNLRHGELLQKTLKTLEQAESDLDIVSLDCTAVLLKQAWDFLGQITGETSNEKIINTIFSKFCLGK